jgi:hypothetical protein
MQMKYILESTTGEFSEYKGHTFETSFLENNVYKDIDASTGLVSDEGTYHYFKTGPDSAEIHYMVSSDGPWKGMHLAEKLHFSTPNQGSVEGEHVGDFVCGYSGTFSIR